MTTHDVKRGYRTTALLHALRSPTSTPDGTTELFRAIEAKLSTEQVIHLILEGCAFLRREPIHEKASANSSTSSRYPLAPIHLGKLRMNPMNREGRIEAAS